MGTGTLVSRSAGQVITAAFFEDIKGILCLDFVGRDSNGIATSGKNLGTSSYPWGYVYASGLILGNVALNPAQLEAPPYQIISGKTRSGSTQPAFIVPAGSSPAFSVLAASVNLVLSVAGVTSTWTADRTGIATSTAPSSNNTATVNDATAAGQAATRTWGEYGSGADTPFYPITISSAGSNITARAGTLQAFKIGTEIFLATIDSSTQLSNCFRGFFFDSSSAPIKRTTFSNGATITLMNLGYVFVDSDGTTVDTIFTGAGVNNTPSFSFSAPSSPASGDYWYDQTNSAWKRYNGSSWVQVNRLLAGLVVSDASNCVAARALDFYGLVRTENTFELTVSSNTVVKGYGLFSRANVNGARISYLTKPPVWDTASNLAASSDRYNAAVTASVTEYFYLTDKGETKISDIEPYWRADLLGWYHPFNPWRAIGWNVVDASVHFQSSKMYSYGSEYGRFIKDFSIPQSKIGGTPNVVKSGSSGAYTTASATPVQPTNQSQSITVTSGIVHCSIEAAAGASVNFSEITPPVGGTFELQLYRNGTQIAIWRGSDGATSAAGGYSFTDDQAGAGTHTYLVKLQKDSGTGNIAYKYMNLVLKEVKI